MVISDFRVVFPSYYVGFADPFDVSSAMIDGYGNQANQFEAGLGFFLPQNIPWLSHSC